MRYLIAFLLLGMVACSTEPPKSEQPENASEDDRKIQLKGESDTLLLGKYLPYDFVFEGDTLPYRILYPLKFSEDKSYPVLTFLHGSLERGDDNVSQLKNGSVFLRDSLSKYQSIIVFPQCAEGDWWANNEKANNGYPAFEAPLDPSRPSMKLLEELLLQLRALPYTDDDRFSIIGISMGGMGAAQLLAKHPGMFRKAAVIAALAPLDYNEALTQTPTWIAHGMSDTIVNPEHSLGYYAAIGDGEGKHKLSLYEHAEHNCWDSLFADPGFLAWMFE